jgi:GT2 family glycosyltransferase/radical SAM superfamily enzyme YgiQ (UPF0313 family)
MIVVRLIGGLGNQMFQYALGRSLSQMHNVPLKLDISGFDSYKLRNYSLDSYNIVADIATEHDLKYLYNKNSVIEETGFNFNPDIFKITPPVYLIGSWQSEKYFNSIKDIIKNDFTIKQPLDIHNASIATQIQMCNSIAIHIRRGDYISNCETNQFHGVCSLDYYLFSIREIAKYVDNLHVFIFSDDHDWVRSNLKFDYPSTYVNHNGPVKDYLDLWLISQCKHQIIANSSFSWWGAWLNPNPQKIVFSPEKWFASADLDSTDLIPDSWFKISGDNALSVQSRPIASNLIKNSEPRNIDIMANQNIQTISLENGSFALYLPKRSDEKKTVLLTTSAAPSQTPFSTNEKRPPIGLGYLISVLRNAGHGVVFIDNYLAPSNFTEGSILQQYKIDFVGIYSNTICFRDTLKMFYRLEELRQRSLWKGKIIVGGPHASVKPETIPDFVDFVVKGEGERAIIDIVENTIFDRIVEYPPLKNLDELPSPAWDFFVKLPYNWGGTWLPEGPVFTMNTSRGCPFSCTFCSVCSVWGKRYTFFSAERVVADIEHVVREFGAKGIYFREDNFTLNRERLVRFCQLLIEKNIRIPWVCETRASNLDRDVIKLMAQSGAVGFYVGVESGSQRLLDFMKKGITVEQIRNVFSWCEEFGIKGAASVIVGVPTETAEDLKATTNLLKDIKPAVTWFNIFVGIPDSELCRFVAEHGLDEFTDDRGLVYLNGHNQRVDAYYGEAWDAKLPIEITHGQIVNPRISVIMSVYNGKDHVKSAMESILRQSYPVFEFIIIDDASTDGTQEILDCFRDPRLRIFHNEKNLGLTKSLNRGINQARGEYIARMDADDFSVPHRFETQVAYLDKNSSVAVVGSSYYLIDDGGTKNQIVDVITDSNTIHNNLMRQNWFGHGSVMMRKSCLESVGGYDEDFIYAQDYDLFLRLSERFKLGNISEPLYCWRKSWCGISQQKKYEQKYFANWARKKAFYRRSSAVVQGVTPLVSVIVPTHNRPDMLKDTIQSILDQTFQNFEIIVVNDAGQDASSVVQAFNSPKIFYLSHETNKGLAAARNTGIRAAKGKYIAYLDDDDVYYVNHLEVLVTFLESTDFYVAYTDAYRATQEFQNGSYATTKRETPYSFDFDYDRILIENFIPVLCIMHRRECLEKSDYFDETLDRHEDWDLWIRMSRHYKFAHIPEITCEFTYRSDGSGMTSGSLPKFLKTLQRVYQKYELEVPADNVIRQQKQKSLFDVCCSVFHFIGDRLNTLLSIDELPYQALTVTGATVSQVRSSYFWKKATLCSDQKQAITFLEKAITEDADNQPAKVDLVSKFIEIGRFTDAISIITKLEVLNPLETIFSITRKNLEEKCDQVRAYAPRGKQHVESLTDHTVKVSIIIPIFNQLPFTKQCLNGLFATLPAAISCEIIVVDNGSSNETGEYLHSLADQATVLSNHENMGFAKACNQGAKAASSKYLLFLNNDTEPQPGWLEPLLNTAEQDSGIAAVGGKLIFPDGTIQHAGVLIADDRVTPDPLVGKHIYYGFPADDSSANVTRGYQVLTAACLLVRRDAFETVQGFDEGYWNGYEDVDLCFKLGQKGWKLIYQPASVVVHHESKSGSERFTKAAQNIQRLHEKWLGIIHPDVIIHPDSRVEWLERVASVATVAEPLVSIIIPLFNQAQLTKTCVEAIRATAGDPRRYELILVDNGSGDWTTEFLKSLDTAVVVITNSENLGFAKACNQGARIAKGEYLLFLNNDTVPQPDWLDALLSGARKGGADIVGAKLLYPNGRVQHAGVAFNKNGIGYHIFKNFPGDTPAVNKKRFMQCVTAACMLVSKQLFNELEGFDEQFQNGFEDVDFCLRAGQSGKRVLYTPDAVVIHHEEQSEGRKQHDRENMQLYLTRWQGLVHSDDEKLYAAEGFSVEWHADGTCFVRPRSAQEVIHENCRYPLIPLVGHSSSSILQKLSSSQRTKGVLKRYTAEE